MAEAGRHAAVGVSRRGFGPALAALGALLVLLVGLSPRSSFALWNDTSTMTGGTIHAGSMDLRLATTLAQGAQGAGTDYAASDITVTNLTPGESYAFPVTVTDAGDADFSLTATVVQAAGWSFTADNPVTVQLFTGAAKTTDTTYPVQQGCDGSPLTAAPVAVAGSPQAVVPPTRVGHGQGLALCLVVAMSSSAGNGNQGQHGALSFAVTATQVTS